MTKKHTVQFLLGILFICNFVGLLVPCGPFPYFPVFSDVGFSDTPLPDRLHGRLGIVRAGLPLADRIIAFRQLNGIALSENQVTEYLSALALQVNRNEMEKNPELMKRMFKHDWYWNLGFYSIHTAWCDQVKRLQPSEAELKRWTEWSRNNEIQVAPDNYQYYQKCLPHAITIATQHLKYLLDSFGTSDVNVREWVNGQAAVFWATPAQAESPKAIDKPQWLKRDRQYQQAAAQFYAAQFANAAELFATIASDNGSPWRAWGAYMQARCWERQAELGVKQNGPEWTRQLRLKAQRHLQAVLQDQTLRDVHAASLDYLDLLKHRLTPEAMVWETASALLQAEIPDNFYVAVQRFQEAKQNFLKLSNEQNTPENWQSETITNQDNESYVRMWPNHASAAADFFRWLLLMDKNPPAHAFEKALAGWEKNKNAVWLIAALQYAPAGHAALPRLLSAIDTLKANHAAQITLAWHKMRWEITALAGAKKKSRLDAELQNKNWPPWVLNSLHKQRQLLASDINDWLKHAVLTIVAEYDGENDSYNELLMPASPLTAPTRPSEVDRLGLDNDGVFMLNSMPLAILIKAVQSDILPKKVNRNVAHMAWVRAAMLERADAAGALAPFLDQNLAKISKKLVAGSAGDERRFAWAATILEFPGLSAFLKPEWKQFRQDHQSFSTFSYEDWWRALECPKIGDNAYYFLTAEQADEAKKELTQICADSLPVDYFARAILGYAKAHVQDTRVPRALYRLVRATKCCKGERTAISREAFDLLHKNYPRHILTKETTYYY